VRLQREHSAQRVDEVGIAQEQRLERLVDIGRVDLEALAFVAADARAPESRARKRERQADHEQRAREPHPPPAT
jgi:hypothetical protein